MSRNISANVTSGTYFCRFYLRLVNLPSGNNQIFAMRNASAGNNLTVSVLTTGVLRLTNGISGLSTTGVEVLSTGVWYRIEVRYLISDTVGELELRLFSGDSTTALETLLRTGEDTLATNFVEIAWTSSGVTHEYYFDDLAINDATGSFQTSWIGPGKIALIEPASDTSITWEDDDLLAAATFANINELPGTPDDAAYNTEIVLLNSIDRFGVSALPAEVPSDADMILLDAYARVGSNQAAAATSRLIVWDEGGTPTNGPNVSSINGWRILSIGPTNEHQVFDLGTRTPANVNSFSLGYENITDLATRPRRISTLWANVEWIEAAAAAVTLDMWEARIMRPERIPYGIVSY